MGGPIKNYIARKLNLLAGPFGINSRDERLRTLVPRSHSRPSAPEDDPNPSSSMSIPKKSSRETSTLLERPPAAVAKEQLDLPWQRFDFRELERLRSSYIDTSTQTNEVKDIEEEASSQASPALFTGTQNTAAISSSESEASHPQSTTNTPADSSITQEEAPGLNTFPSPTSHNGKICNTEFVPLTDGPSRIVQVDDGGKDCIAVLVTRDMLKKLNHVTTTVRKYERSKQIVSAAGTAARWAESSLEGLKIECQTIENKKQSKSLGKQKSYFEAKIAWARERESLAENQAKYLEAQIKFAREQSHEIFEEILGEAELLEPFEPEEDDGEADFDRNWKRSKAAPSIRSEESIISLEELNRRTVMDEYENWRNELLELQDKDYRREEDAHREEQEYEEAVRNGETDCTRKEFDCLAEIHEQRLDEALAEAEIEFAAARARARALDLVGNEPWQESDFVDDPNDGCADTEIKDDGEETNLAVHKVNDSKINKWLDRISDAQTEEVQSQEPAEELLEDAESTIVDISDSISCRDAPPAWRRRIDRWNEVNGRDK